MSIIISSYKISLVLISFRVTPLLAKYVLSLFFEYVYLALSSNISALKVYQNLEYCIIYYYGYC
jgi:hypothetical protein